jgi:hypothetical protein
MLQTTDENVLADFQQDIDLQWPNIPPLSGEQIPEEWLQEADKLAGNIGRFIRVSQEEPHELIKDFARRLFDSKNEEDTSVAAIALSLACMVHPHPLIQVCAAVASIGLARNPLRTGQAFNILARYYSEAPSTLLEHLSFIGIARILRNQMRTGRIALEHTSQGLAISKAPLSVNQSEVKNALLIHGTVFQGQGRLPDLWWMPPAGDLHHYLKSGSISYLYSGDDHFRWSGGWSHYARAEGAEKLIEWMISHGIQCPDVIAHSHGGNLSMLASHSADLNRLVLLSCPVHWSSYSPRRVADVLSIRIRWDLVIMADGGAQHFPKNAGIREHVLPFWFFGHNKTHESSTWLSERLDRHIFDANPITSNWFT